jgi:hypothetical protein
VRRKRRSIRRTTRGAANRVEVDFNIFQAERYKEARAKFNHLNINTWTSVPDRFNVELRELTVATLLRSVVSEEWGNRD